MRITGKLGTGSSELFITKKRNIQVGDKIRIRRINESYKWFTASVYEIEREGVSIFYYLTF